MKNRYHYAKVVEMQEQIFQSVLIAPYCFLEKRTSGFLKQLCQLFFAMARLPVLSMCKDISIEILPIPHWTFTCFSKNGHKALKPGVKFVET